MMQPFLPSLKQTTPAQKSRAGLYFLPLLLFTATIWAASPAIPVQQALLPLSKPISSTDANVYTHELSNGLKILVKVDTRSPLVVSQVWYKVGGSYEPLGLTGISHALEHMMFKGTKNYKAGQFSRLIAAEGGQDNAVTTQDYTAYYQTLAAEKLPLAFQLEADRMQNLLVAPEEFAKEIEVIKEERRMRTDNNPNALTFERLNAAAFLASPYHHPVVGWMNDLNQLTAQDVLDWYHRWYAPNNALLVVAGDVEPQQVFSLAERYFGAIPRKDMPRLKVVHEPPELGQRRVQVSGPGQLPYLILAYNVPSFKTTANSNQVYSLEVLAGLLSAGNSSRLSTELVRKERLASAANAYYSLYSRLSNLLILTAIPNGKTALVKLTLALQAQVQALQTKLVSEKELQRVKTQLIASHIFEQDSITNAANTLGSLESVGLNYRIDDAYPKAIAKVTPEQIREVARLFLTPKRLTIAEFVPAPEKGNTNG